MSEQTDPNYLVNEQYADAGSLSTRIEIQEQYSTNPRSWFHWVFDRLHLRPHSRILELGCGTGDLWIKNLARLPEGLELILSDLSMGMLQEARRRFPSGDLFHYSVMDVQAIPIEEGELDTVIANGLLDHVPDRVRALGEIHRVLRPGGIFYTTAGGRFHLQEIESLVKPFVPDADFGGDPARFGLENGVKLLSPWFSDVRRGVYKAQLVFREPDPIIAYVLSESSIQKSLAGERLERFRDFVMQVLDEQGKIEVTTEKGLFRAR